MAAQNTLSSYCGHALACYVSEVRTTQAEKQEPQLRCPLISGGDNLVPFFFSADRKCPGKATTRSERRCNQAGDPHRSQSRSQGCAQSKESKSQESKDSKSKESTESKESKEGKRAKKARAKKAKQARAKKARAKKAKKAKKARAIKSKESRSKESKSKESKPSSTWDKNRTKILPGSRRRNAQGAPLQVPYVWARVSQVGRMRAELYI